MTSLHTNQVDYHLTVLYIHTIDIILYLLYTLGHIHMSIHRIQKQANLERVMKLVDIHNKVNGQCLSEECAIMMKSDDWYNVQPDNAEKGRLYMKCAGDKQLNKKNST